MSAKEKAKLAYKKHCAAKLKIINIRFNVVDHGDEAQAFEHIKSQPNQKKYILKLVKEDMIK